MAYFLNEEQEVALNEFLNEENKKICEEQILQDKIPKEFRDLMEKTLESGSPIPFFDPLAGYYTVSFTPCEKGDRIYAHHHLSGVSKSIYDPALVIVNTEDVSNESEEDEFLNEQNIDLESIDDDSDVDYQDKITNVHQDEEGIFTPN